MDGRPDVHSCEIIYHNSWVCTTTPQTDYTYLGTLILQEKDMGFRGIGRTHIKNTNKYIVKVL